MKKKSLTHYGLFIYGGGGEREREGQGPPGIAGVPRGCRFVEKRVNRERIRGPLDRGPEGKKHEFTVVYFQKRCAKKDVNNHSRI